MRSKNLTADGAPELEQHLALICAKIAAGIRGLVPRRKLEAVLLGGGYGRGEGGVLETPAGPRPYNDLEFYVCLRGHRHLNELRFGRALHVLGEILTPQAGVEVEFKITSLRELAAAPVSMFSYDLVVGHRWLIGREEQLAACAHHRDPAQIPLNEATRLLMNRCSGLLFAQERLEKREFTAGDADFVRRNIAKADLALGDAVLVAFGHYHWSVRERHRQMERLARGEPLPWLPAVRLRHAAGVEFKLHPERSTASRETLHAQHHAVAQLAKEVWLWVESRRLGRPIQSIRDYVELDQSKYDGASALRNLAINLRALGPRGVFSRRGLRHPRERILNAMPLLLWQPEALRSADGLPFLQGELQTTATTFAELMQAYRALWSLVN